MRQSGGIYRGEVKGKEKVEEKEVEEEVETVPRRLPDGADLSLRVSAFSMDIHEAIFPFQSIIC